VKYHFSVEMAATPDRELRNDAAGLHSILIPYWIRGEEKIETRKRVTCRKLRDFNEEAS
jgi:hypothetical protein